jgi:hypothetical protein
MQQLIKDLPPIIEAAAKSPLGIIALIVIAASIVLYLLFRKEKLWGRLFAFALFAGLLVFIVASVIASQQGQEPVPVDDRGGSGAFAVGDNACATSEFSAICDAMPPAVRAEFQRQVPLITGVDRFKCSGAIEHAWTYDGNTTLLLRRYASRDCENFSSYQSPSDRSTDPNKIQFVRRSGGAFQLAQPGLKLLRGEPFEFLEIVRFCEDVGAWDHLRIDANKFDAQSSTFRGEVNIRRAELAGGDSPRVYVVAAADPLSLKRDPAAVVKPYDTAQSLWAVLMREALPLLQAPDVAPPLVASPSCARPTVLDDMIALASLEGDWATLQLTQGTQPARSQYLVLVGRPTSP